MTLINKERVQKLTLENTQISYNDLLESITNIIQNNYSPYTKKFYPENEINNCLDLAHKGITGCPWSIRNKSGRIYCEIEKCLIYTGIYFILKYYHDNYKNSNSNRNFNNNFKNISNVSKGKNISNTDLKYFRENIKDHLSSLFYLNEIEAKKMFLLEEECDLILKKSYTSRLSNKVGNISNKQSRLIRLIYLLKSSVMISRFNYKKNNVINKLPEIFKPSYDELKNMITMKDIENKIKTNNK